MANPTVSPGARWALITGVSAGGLGDALMAALLKQTDLNVIAPALSLTLLDYIPSNPRIAKLELDVTSPSSIAAASTQATALTRGCLHYLFNNASYGYMTPLLEASIDKVRDNFEVNVFGLLAVTQAFFPLLHEAKGAIINQCSIASLPPGRQPFIGSYSASKAALASLNDTLRIELAPFGVQVICLVTGDVRTTFWTRQSAVSLPSESLYAPVREHAEAMMRGETNPAGGHDRHRWAEAVVRDVTARNASKFVRRGFLATTMWCASLILPTWVADWAFTRTARLEEITTTQREKAAKG